MAGIIEEGRNGFNVFVREQAEMARGAYLYLTIFDDQYDVIHDMVPLEDVPELTSDVFYARSMTALLDAVGRTINTVQGRIDDLPEDEKPEKVIVTIFTDGHENASTEFTQAAIKKMIEDLQANEGWEFIYMGANQDAFAEAQNYGINLANVSNFAATRQSMSDSYSYMSSNVRSMRAGIARKDMAENVDDIDVAAFAVQVDADIADKANSTDAE